VTKPPIKNDKELSQICVTCGFCCSGVLYDQAPLEDEEADFARSIGLDVGPIPGSDTGRLRFKQPCPHLCGTACSIYGRRRPNICSRFFCELAAKFDRGEITQAESISKVRRAQKLLLAIEPLLLPGETWPMARARWFANRNKAPENLDAAQFQVLMTALNFFLDRHFRKERQRVVSVGNEMESDIIEGE
jgi:hypothetical protein